MNDLGKIKILVGSPAALAAETIKEITGSPAINVRAIRGVRSQSDFAAAIGVPIGTVANWEQGRRQPTGAARVLLRLIKYDPDIIRRLHATPAADNKSQQ